MVSLRTCKAAAMVCKDWYVTPRWRRCVRTSHFAAWARYVLLRARSALQLWPSGMAQNGCLAWIVHSPRKQTNLTSLRVKLPSPSFMSSLSRLTSASRSSLNPSWMNLMFLPPLICQYANPISGTCLPSVSPPLSCKISSSMGNVFSLHCLHATGRIFRVSPSYALSAPSGSPALPFNSSWKLM